MKKNKVETNLSILTVNDIETFLKQFNIDANTKDIILNFEDVHGLTISVCKRINKKEQQLLFVADLFNCHNEITQKNESIEWRAFMWSVIGNEYVDALREYFFDKEESVLNFEEDVKKKNVQEYHGALLNDSEQCLDKLQQTNLAKEKAVYEEYLRLKTIHLDEEMAMFIVAGKYCKNPKEQNRSLN